MKKNIFLVAVMALAAFTACTKNEVDNQEAKVKMVKIVLSTETGVEILGDADTKTMLTETMDVHWHKGDGIYIKAANADEGKLTNESESGPSARFVGTAAANLLLKTDAIAVYPLINGLEEWGGWIKNVVTPAEQPLLSNTFAQNCNVAAAAVDMTSAEAVEFKNVGGLLCLRLKGDVEISAIEITAPEAVALNGKYEVKASKSNGVTTLQTQNLTNTTESVKLSSPTAIPLTNEAQRFYACVLPYETTGEYNIRIITDRGYSVTKAVSLSKGVTAGKVTTLGEFEILNSDFNTESRDLSIAGSSNTYYVSEPGNYKFKATVKGNGKALNYNNLTYTEEDLVIAPQGALVLWYSSVQNSNSFTKTSPIVLESVRLDENGYITFITPETFVSGNVVIAAMEKAMVADEIAVSTDRIITNNRILWSWNIVCAEGYNPDTAENNITTPSGYVMMGRDLGAAFDYTQYTSLGANGNVEESVDLAYAMGNTYQYGNKNPRPGIAKYVNDVSYAMTGLYHAPNYTPIAALQMDGVGASSWVMNEQMFGGQAGSNTAKSTDPRNIIPESERLSGRTYSTSENWANTYPYLFPVLDNSRWLSGSDGNMVVWGSKAGEVGVKTIYDPCPYGWKVASEVVWNDLLGVTKLSNNSFTDGDLSKFELHQSGRGFVYDNKSIFLFGSAISPYSKRDFWHGVDDTQDCYATYITTSCGPYFYEDQVLVGIKANSGYVTGEDKDAHYAGHTQKTEAHGGSVRCVKINE